MKKIIIKGGIKMKLNKSKLKTKEFMILSDMKDETDFRQGIYILIEKIKRGQASRKENTLNELWGIEDLEKLIDCIDFKEV